MAIAIRNIKEIDLLRKSNSIVAQSLQKVKEYAKVGVSLNDLDKIADDFILSFGAKPSFKGLYGFPKSICLSVNDVIIHGIPSDYKLKKGDILGVDIGVEYGGWYGDGAITFGIDEINKVDEKIIKCSYDTLLNAINSIRVGMRFKELSFILQSNIESFGFVPLKGFCGHGIGKKPHEEPEIPNFIESSVMQGPKIKNGMVFCIEPMVCQTNGNPKILNDKWSVVSEDRLNGSHYEHTIAIVDNKAIILTEY
ncbi:type I methionyl aminopeptidase [Helicobacter sp. MIT 14-3879]|uniref:type I methionyl aminopeptidase n=1 Tax=Helicobacter sp. MIT 14-3879 TaxID=2040649 RepID=UPI000E1F6295|nr:type I methionyl aminopeptidase [Helicobacter sp. MIT 14-3879]RDU64134.1 type I methionyl aminopeptidase [Helicobacter sp. MIT 14-3879]